MENKFLHGGRLKRLKAFKYDVVVYLIGQFSSRKRVKKVTTKLSKFPSSGADIHQVTRVPYQNRDKCNLCTKRKIDSRTCICFDVYDLFLCQTSKKTVLGNGILVLITKFCLKYVHVTF